MSHNIRKEDLHDGQIVWTFGKPESELAEPSAARVTSYGLVWTTNGYVLGWPACHRTPAEAWLARAERLEDDAAALRARATRAEQEAVACRARAQT